MKTSFTREELNRLPVYGGFGIEERVIDGQAVRVPVMARPVQAFAVADDTPLMWIDPDGTRWRLAQYTDGMWCKRRAA